ncbi:hypothetical protein ACFLYK_00660 [Candidatus Cloacimonadota bacterium]
MKNLLILVCLVVMLSACDRFERNFEVDEEILPVGPFFEQFSDILENLSDTNLPEVMSYYDDDYSNDGKTKADIEVLYNSFIEDDLNITATLLDTTNIPNLTWHLMAENTAKEIVYDEEIADVLVIRDDAYLFFGDQADKSNIIVELFTGTWCTYCPFAEEALHELKEQYGSRLSYTEYHIGDPLDGGFSTLLNYYPNQGTLPITIINGNAAILSGGGEGTQDEIEAVLQQLIDEPLTAGFTDASAVIDGDVLTGSVTIDLDSEIPIADLKLVIILQEITNDDYFNYNGNELHNIAIKRRELDITSGDQVINFSIDDLDDLASGYERLPDDLTLLIWIQRLEASYSQETCRAYNVIEITPEQIEKK